MNLLRPNYDAACASLTGALALSLEQIEALWSALVPVHAQTAVGRKRWSPVAMAFLTPLYKEVTTVNRHRSMAKFDKINVAVPGGASVSLGEMHFLYRERLAEIQARISAALREGGHFCVPEADDLAQPLRVVVANERAAGRPAGNSDWTQWEDVSTVRKMTRIFENGYTPIKGPRWAPYQPYGSRGHGAATNNRAVAVWRTAFYDRVQEVNSPTSVLRQYLPASQPMIAFQASLRSAPVQQAIEDAIRVQVQAHRGPLNPAFQTPRDLWHALDRGVRIELAAQFHEALVALHESMLAAGHPDAAQYDPALTTNPYELTEEERNEQ